MTRADTIIDKTFDPAEIEARLYAHWETTGAFRPARPDAKPFTIVIPPPNVTGSLHIGHALDNTLQDVLIRYHRLKGEDALWVVGTDHAGIATQMVVERQLELAQDKRTNYTRDAFVDKVWEWKTESGGTITRQLRRLGASCDWSNERFTMDEGISAAVTKVFVRLYNEKLLYRDKRLVNWDPHFKTAISDLEVETREVAGHFWHFRYPLADGVRLADGRDYIVVATTRPETMLGDMAVAVNASDARYQSVIGKHIILPITGRRIPIIADDHADPELGSGAVKITPGHDFNDFEVGKRAGFAAADMLNMLDAEARVAACDGVPERLIGLDRFAARKVVVAEIEALGLLELIEDKTVQMPYGDRSGVVIEPWLTDQWYVDAKTLAEPAIAAVRSGATKFVPANWDKTYFNWMENIQPWCVSRQLWWGHRIPAWYGPRIDLIDGAETLSFSAAPERSTASEQVVFVAETFEAACIQATAYYSKFERFRDGVQIVEVADHLGFMRWFDSPEADKGQVALQRDSDVLDTWFSSALWPFATLGWTGDTPTTVIPTAAATKTDVIPAQAGIHDNHRRLDSRFRGNDENEGGNDGREGVGADRREDEKENGNDVRGRWGDDGGRVADDALPTPLLPTPSLLARHYPGDVLVTGFDIIFFWVARMMMQGIHFMDAPPFATVYCHGLVRDAKGAKMSKSKGNVVDPLILIDKFGADALRFTLTAMESQGRDIKLDEKRIEGYRNFATKLWNAARFAQSNGIIGSTSVEPPAATVPVNRWIIGEVIGCARDLDAAIAAFRFDDYASTIYQFVWSRFCDWYLELTKPLLAEGADPEVAAETRAVTGWALDQILVMLHPVMPFLTEELWHKLAPRDHDLIVASWPVTDAALIDADTAAEIVWLIRLVSDIRAARAELNVSPAAKLPLHVRDGEAATQARISRQILAIERLARIVSISFEPAPAGGAAQVVVDAVTYVLPLEGVIDLAAERARLEKAAAGAEKEAAALTGRLGSPGFTEKAKPEAVEKARDDLAARSSEALRLRAALSRLG